MDIWFAFWLVSGTEVTHERHVTLKSMELDIATELPFD